MIKIVSRDLPTSIYANYSTDTSLSESRARQTKDENSSVLEYARQKPHVPIFFKFYKLVISDLSFYRLRVSTDKISLLTDRS